MRGLVLIGAVAVSLAACGGDAAERAFFERAQALKQTGQFKLADAVPGDWTSVCFHGGYAEVPALKIKNAETDWTLVFYRGEAEIARVQGTYRKLVLNTPNTASARDCHSRDAAIVWEGQRAMFRAGGR